MRLAFTITMLLLARHARADLHLRSTGREVTVELTVDGTQHACRTPCMLDVPAGSYRARVDGLDRTITAGAGDVVITPTSRGRLLLAIALGTLASTGLTFAGHWASPLDDRQRLTAGLVGVAALGFMIPVIASASVRVNRDATQSHADVFAGVHDIDEPMAVVGVGFRPQVRGFGAELRGRFTADPDRYDFVAGPTYHLPRVPLVRPAVAARVGIASRRSAPTIADPPIPGELGLHLLVDFEARLELAIPGRIQPSVGGTLQALPDHAYALDVGVHVRF